MPRSERQRGGSPWEDERGCLGGSRRDTQSAGRAKGGEAWNRLLFFVWSVCVLFFSVVFLVFVCFLRCFFVFWFLCVCCCYVSLQETLYNWLVRSLMRVAKKTLVGYKWQLNEQKPGNMMRHVFLNEQKPGNPCFFYCYSLWPLFQGVLEHLPLEKTLFEVYMTFSAQTKAYVSRLEIGGLIRGSCFSP